MALLYTRSFPLVQRGIRLVRQSSSSTSPAVIQEFQREGWLSQETSDVILSVNRDTFSIQIEQNREISPPSLRDTCTLVSLLQPSLKRCSQPSVLDLGCGSGYISAILMLLVQENKGSTTALDRDPDRVDAGVKAVTSCMGETSADAFKSFVYMPLDGTKDWGPNSPYHAIRLGFALPTLDCPQAEILFEQLRVGGRMVAPVGVGDEQRLWLVEKDEEKRKVANIAAGREKLEYPVGLVQHNLKLSNEEEAALVAARAEAALVKSKLDKWKTGFESTHGRKPSRSDLFADPVAAALFQRFAALRSASE